MELGYLRRLHLKTAGRVSFGERTRPAAPNEAQNIDKMLIYEIIAVVMRDLNGVNFGIIDDFIIEQLANKFFERAISEQGSVTGRIYGILSVHLMRYETEI